MQRKRLEDRIVINVSGGSTPTTADVSPVYGFCAKRKQPPRTVAARTDKIRKRKTAQDVKEPLFKVVTVFPVIDLTGDKEEEEKKLPDAQRRIVRAERKRSSTGTLATKTMGNLLVQEADETLPEQRKAKKLREDYENNMTCLKRLGTGHFQEDPNAKDYEMYSYENSTNSPTGPLVSPERTKKVIENNTTDSKWTCTFEVIACPICTETFRKGETVKNTICFHSFHGQCIEEWFKCSFQCPVCKNDCEKRLTQ